MMLFYVLLVLSGVGIGFLICYMMVGVKELRRKAELYDAGKGETRPPQ
jgi:hypothetical protein